MPKSAAIVAAPTKTTSVRSTVTFRNGGIPAPASLIGRRPVGRTLVLIGESDAQRRHRLIPMTVAAVCVRGHHHDNA
jgi:hypothetical protein